MDPTVAEVADQTAMADPTEAPRRQSSPPGRVEEWTMLQPQQESSRNIEHVNEAQSSAVVLIPGAWLPVPECDYDVAAHVLNPKGSVIRGKIGIEETAGHAHMMEFSVKNIDAATLEVARVKPRTLRGGRERDSFIDRATGVIHFDDRTGRIRVGIPAGNRTVFGGE